MTSFTASLSPLLSKGSSNDESVPGKELNGSYGLTEWYPNVRKTRESQESVADGKEESVNVADGELEPDEGALRFGARWGIHEHRVIIWNTVHLHVQRTDKASARFHVVLGPSARTACQERDVFAKFLNGDVVGVGLRITKESNVRD